MVAILVDFASSVHSEQASSFLVYVVKRVHQNVYIPSCFSCVAFLKHVATKTRSHCSQRIRWHKT